MTALIVLLGLAVALLAVLVVGLLRTHAQVLRALHDLGVDLDGDRSTAPPGVTARAVEGSEARPLSGLSPTGDAVAVSTDQPGTMTLLAFLTSGCLTCAGFWEAFARPQDLDLPSSVRLVIVTKGADHESPERVASLAPRRTTVVMSSEAWIDYGIQVSPYFVLVDSGAVVGEGAAQSWAQVRSLMGQAFAEAPSPPTTRRLRPSTDADRERRVDEELARAGIEPGDPRLHQRPEVS